MSSGDVVKHLRGKDELGAFLRVSLLREADGLEEVCSALCSSRVASIQTSERLQTIRKCFVVHLIAHAFSHWFRRLVRAEFGFACRT